MKMIWKVKVTLDEEELLVGSFGIGTLRRTFPPGLQQKLAVQGRMRHHAEVLLSR
jgi:hypothetical protein